eukprot:13711532-Alexandrium_andersonii.AAC.1
MGRAQTPDAFEGARSAHRLLAHALRVLIVRDVDRNEARRERATRLIQHVKHCATHLSARA